MKYKIDPSYEIVEQENSYLLVSVKKDCVITINQSAYDLFKLLNRGLSFEESFDILKEKYSSINERNLKNDFKELLTSAKKKKLIIGYF